MPSSSHNFRWNNRISRRGGGWNGVVHPPRLKTHTSGKFYLKGNSFPGHSIRGPCQMSRVTRAPVHQTLAMLPYHPHLVMFQRNIQPWKCRSATKCHMQCPTFSTNPPCVVSRFALTSFGHRLEVWIGMDHPWQHNGQATFCQLRLFSQGLLLESMALVFSLEECSFSGTVVPLPIRSARLPVVHPLSEHLPCARPTKATICLRHAPTPRSNLSFHRKLNSWSF